MSILDALKYISIWAQVSAALEAVRSVGESGRHTIRGIRYKGRVYDLELQVRRTD